MMRGILAVAVAMLTLSACNSKSATDEKAEGREEATESTAAPTDSITAAVSRLNEVVKSGQSSTNIDSITFADGELTIYYVSPPGYLDDKENKMWLPSMAVNDLPLLGQGALQQIIDSKTKVKCEYTDKDNPAKKYSFNLSQKDIAGKLAE